MKKNIAREMVYKGYIGKIDTDEQILGDNIIFGKVINIDAVITFRGNTDEEAEQSFKDSVDAYLEFCKELGEEPDIKGRLYYNKDGDTTAR